MTSTDLNEADVDLALYVGPFLARAQLGEQCIEVALVRRGGLPRGSLALALVAFNLGVEGGQLAIVTAFVPLAYGARRTTLYARMVFQGGSLAIMLVAALWVVQRSLDLKLQLALADAKPETVGILGPINRWTATILRSPPPRVRSLFLAVVVGAARPALVPSDRSRMA